jgi:signal transduction histidine kinase
MSRFELYIGFAILVLVFTPVLIGSFVVISELETTQGDLLSKNATDVIEAERLNSLLNQEFALVQSFVLRGKDGLIKQLDSVHHEFQVTAANLLMGIEINESPEVLKEIRRLEGENFAAVKGAISLKTNGATIPELNEYFDSTNLTRGAQVLQLVRDNVDVQNAQMHEARDYVNRTSHRLVIGLISACAFAFVATATVIVLLYQMIRNKAAEDRQRDEKMKLESDLSNARKEVVEVVAHDLKNPLSAMKMSLELLKDELGDLTLTNSEVAMGFQIAWRSIISMQRLIDDQLDHTKIESGQLVLDRILSNMTDLLRDNEMRFRPLLEAKGLTFITKLDRSMFSEVDSARIDQVISNLLGNALKFTPAGGIVELIGEIRGSQIVVKVKDNGPGLTKDAVSHIFERYWQVKESANKGTGLGLSIAKGIVEAHGGKLTCLTEVGQGCEFEFEISSAELHRPLAVTTH